MGVGVCCASGTSPSCHTCTRSQLRARNASKLSSSWSGTLQLLWYVERRARRRRQLDESLVVAGAHQLTINSPAPEATDATPLAHRRHKEQQRRDYTTARARPATHGGVRPAALHAAAWPGLSAE